tara:strand:- start:3759 stop:4328 length:570 start_codon:yes stop_codon:yes gene_type:complete
VIIIPRKAPKEVVEHRITLGDYERKQLTEFIDSYQKDKVVENVPNLMIGTAALGITAVVGFVGYALYYWFDSVPSIKEVIDGIRDKITEPSEKVREGLEKALDAKYLELSHAEIYAKKAESDARFEQMIEGLTQRANLLLKSNFPMQKSMGQKILDSIPAMRQKHRDKWSDILTRWNQVHLDNNPDHLG